jgi:hypothetical protein
MSSLLYEAVVALLAIMLLDYFKGWRGWKYYALALVVLLAFQIGTTLAGIMIHR